MPDTEKERLRVYLSKVHLKGFKSIEDLTIDIQKGLNILIGKNGAGKSNFLEVLYQLIKVRNYTKIPFKYGTLDFITDDGHLFTTEIEREVPNKGQRDNLDNRDLASRRFFIDGELKYSSLEDAGTRKLIEFKGKKINAADQMRSLIRSGYEFIYPLLIKYDLPQKLGMIESSGTITTAIEDDDYVDWNFPESLNFINDIFFFGLDLSEYQTNKDKFSYSKEYVYRQLAISDNILSNLRRFTPIEDVRFNPNINLYVDDKSLIIDNIKLDFKINDNWLPWSQLSDGTRRLFYIVSEVTYNGSIVLIEEPELGIYPHQFNLLMDFLKEQSEEKQIIISTHSPKALDILSPDELNNILIAYYDKGKGTQIRHLTEADEQKAKRYMKEVGFFSDYWLLSDLE